MITYLLYIIGVSLVSRTVYLHHYLLPYTLGIVLFGALLAYILPLIENRCIKALQFLCIIATMSMFGAHIWYAPFTYNLPLTPEQYRVRDVFLWWHLDDAFEGLELPTSPMHTTSNGTS